MILYLLIFILIVCVVGAGCYQAGRSRASEYDKIKKAEYKEMSARVSDITTQRLNATSRADAYESALKDIAAGRGIPEMTAQAALSLFNK